MASFCGCKDHQGGYSRNGLRLGTIHLGQTLFSLFGIEDSLRVEDITSVIRVEKAEDLLKSLGFVQVRVRDHNQMARIELPSEDKQRALNWGRDRREAQGYRI